MTEIETLVGRLSEELKADPLHKKLWDRVSSVNASFGDANAYSGLVGKKAGRLVRIALEDHVINDSIADEFLHEYIPSMLRSVYSDVNSYSKAVWAEFNKIHRIGIDVMDAFRDEDRYDRIATEISNKGYEKTKDVISSQIETVSRSVVDDSIKRNIKFQNSVGIQTRVTRTYGGRGLHNGTQDCEWCKARCGADLTLQEAYEIELFNRHEGCTCKVVATLPSGRRQDSWTKAYI